MSMVMSIHQPGELVFEMCDRLLLLSGGKQVYFGPPADAQGHFQALGLEVPPRTSLAEFLLDRCNGDFSAGEKAPRS